MTALKELFSGGARKFGMVFALLALVIIFNFATNGLVVTPTNAQNIIFGNAHILVMTMGMVLVIIAGHIDLSVGSVAAAVGVIVAVATRDWGVPWWAGILLGVACGLIIGAWQGFWVAYVGIPGFITTLAGMMLFRGLHLYISAQAGTNVRVPKEMWFIGSGHLPEWGPDTGLNNSTLVLGLVGVALVVWGEMRRRANAKRLQGEAPSLSLSLLRAGGLAIVIGYLTWLFGSGRPGTSFPVTGLIVLAIAAIYWFLSTKTITGRHVYAVGGNRAAAALSGVNIKRVNFLVMMNMSLLASVAAILFISRARTTGPADGTGWELDVIAAVFIGGAAVSGGIGTVTGSLIGGMVMAVLNNGLQLMGVGAAQNYMIKGLVLLTAVAFDVYNKVQGRPSIIGKITDSLRGPTTTEAAAPAAPTPTSTS
ncbi:sugar ABC transporter permease [Xylanimonas ulmi]|uniref:Xylose transport system permease protein XylH n=1 Tax=Xylanimonas ulmi TaxID=228973 RepID=A0A4Q7M5Y2_9MICO|nr:sugar ABC transporter permease [Xylanibacterium ulmi]RZS62881.1 putative multiple sugar transport system permease protein [Xylanibacterium ulmi]